MIELARGQAQGAGLEQLDVGLLTYGNDDEKNEEGVGDRDDRGGQGKDDLVNSRAQADRLTKRGHTIQDK